MAGDPSESHVPSTRAEKAKEREIVREAHEKAAAPAAVVYRAILEEGEDELSRPASALAWSGLAAGLSMGFSLVAEGLIRSHLPDAPWRPLLTKFGYSVGFLFAVLGRQQLFTENTLTAVLPVLTKRSRHGIVNMLRLWSVVFVSNIIGTILFAYALAKTPAFESDARRAFLEIARSTYEFSFAATFIKAIFAGWLIALMVWLLPVAETARVAVIIIVTYVVGLGQLSHIIAGSVEAAYVVACGHATWPDYLGKFLVPTLLGNILGGTSLVAALNHAQVVSGKE